MKILANDGISQSGIDDLTAAGFEVLTTTVAQEQLIVLFLQEEFIETKLYLRVLIAFFTK